MYFKESIDILSSSLQPGTCTTPTALTALIMQKNRIISNVYCASLKMASRLHAITIVTEASLLYFLQEDLTC
jgi:hypothetical protein